MASEHTKLRKKLWKLTREIVFKTYGKNCYTCGQKNLTGSNCQGGHVPWPASILSTVCKFDVRFIRPQCYSCNINKGGMGAVALERMQKEGIDIEQLKRLNQETKGGSFGKTWFKEAIKEAEEKLSLLANI